MLHLKCTLNISSMFYHASEAKWKEEMLNSLAVLEITCNSASESSILKLMKNLISKIRIPWAVMQKC